MIFQHPLIIRSLVEIFLGDLSEDGKFVLTLLEISEKNFTLVNSGKFLHKKVTNEKYVKLKRNSSINFNIKKLYHIYFSNLGYCQFYSFELKSSVQERFIQISRG